MTTTTHSTPAETAVLDAYRATAADLTTTVDIIKAAAALRDAAYRWGTHDAQRAAANQLQRLDTQWAHLTVLAAALDALPEGPSTAALFALEEETTALLRLVHRCRRQTLAWMLKSSGPSPTVDGPDIVFPGTAVRVAIDARSLAD